MKHTLFILISALAAMCMISCGSSHDKTITNLKAAIDGETAASAKYAAYGDRAEQEGYAEVAALFRATSQAENIHIQNHLNVLRALGVMDYTAATPEFPIDSTLVNLQAAMEGELYESEQMYPGFLAPAEQEGVADAVTSFTHAERAEAGHAALYAAAIETLNTPGAQAAVYYICPVCGNVYAGNAAEICEICGVPQAQFIAVHAVMALGGDQAPLGAPVFDPAAK